MKKEVLVLSAAIATASFHAIADDSVIETIVVTGEKEPGNMALTAQDLENIQAATLEDIFANETSVAVGGGSPAAQKIYVRGFEDVMLNVTVDGAQSPGELYHHQARVQLEPEFIKNIELDAGAGVATNGAGALTGALKVTLKDAFDMLDHDQRFGGLIKGTKEFNGEDGEKATGSIYGKLGENTGVILGVTYEDRGEYEDGEGNLVEASPYSRTRSFVKLNSALDEHEFSLSFENIDDEATTYERPNLTNFRGNFQLSDQEMTRQTMAFNYGYDASSDLVDVKTTVFSNTSDFKVQRQNSDLVYGDGEFGSIGFDIRNTSTLNRHNITYGVDYRTDELTSSQNATPPAYWGETEQKAEVAGVYVQDNWSALSTLDVSFGLRFDHYVFEGEGGVSDGIVMSDSGFSPNLGITWEVVRGLELRTAYAQAFRGVAIREAFFSGLYIHDGNLESETADNLEFGISYELNGFFARGTVYEQNIENFIDIQFVGGTNVWGYWVNKGDAKVDGYEAELGYYNQAISTSLSMWNAENELNGEPLTDADLGLGTTIGRTWVARFDYFASETLNLGTQIRHVEAVENSIDDNAPDKEAYTTVRAYATWKPLEMVGFSLAVNNIFDEFYFDHATYTYNPQLGVYAGYPAMGREIMASATLRF